MMTNKMTPTLALVLAGGLAAGIALARPGITAGAGADSPPSATEATQAANGGGYLGGNRAADDAAASPTTGTVTIRDFAFAGSNVVAPGASIEVTNDDAAAHTLTSDSGLFDTGNLGQGQTATVLLPGEPGTYTYFCAIHPSMTGSVTVR